MPYTINKTNGQLFAVIADGTIDTTSRLKLIGKNVTSFGEIQNQNYIQLLESGANGTAPPAPLAGELWFDNSGTGILKVYNGSEFRDLAVSTVTATPPPVPIEGDIWYDTANSQLNVFDGTNYLLLGPAFTSSDGTSGAVVELISDGIVDHVVTVLYNGSERVATISKDATFTTVPGVQGFATIGPGIQLSTNIAGLTPDFIGTATNAALLDNLDSTQFLRSDTNDTTTGSLAVLNDAGLVFGNGGDCQLSIVSGNTQMQNINPGADMMFTLGTTDVLTLDSASNRARVNAPIAGTDIANKDYVDDSVQPNTTAIQANLSTLTTHSQIAGAFYVHEAAVPDMTVVIEGGSIQAPDVISNVAQQISATIPVPAVLSYYYVEIDPVTGVASVIDLQTTTATFGAIRVARLTLPAGTTAITNSMIEDWRPSNYLSVKDDDTLSDNSAIVAPSQKSAAAYVANYVASYVDGTGLVMFPNPISLGTFTTRITWETFTASDIPASATSVLVALNCSYSEASSSSLFFSASLRKTGELGIPLMQVTGGSQQTSSPVATLYGRAFGQAIVGVNNLKQFDAYSYVDAGASTSVEVLLVGYVI